MTKFMKLKMHSHDIQSIFTREDILENLDKIVASLTEFYENISPEIFFELPNDGGWSPEKNLRHLIKSTQPIYLGLIFPKFTLYLFGFRKKKSMSMIQVQKAYLEKLNSGRGAGVFTPIGNNFKVDPELQKKMIYDFITLFAKYKKQIARWKDQDLDNYNLPHPILGNITVREMILFSIFHLFHHTEKLELRLN